MYLYHSKSSQALTSSYSIMLQYLTANYRELNWYREAKLSCSSKSN